MAEQLEILKRLQGLDGQLYQLRRQRADKPRELEQAAAVVEARQAQLSGVEARLKSLQMAQKEKELELQTKEASVKKFQAQLFQVKTNKEYAALQREIEALKADNSLLEEAILKTLEAIDEVFRERTRTTQQLEEQQRRWRSEQERVTRELEAIKEQVAQLERERQTLVSEVHPQTLVSYERVLHLREGLALVPLVGEACGGCDRRLPPQVINEVYLKPGLVSCEHCSRILYFDDARSKL